MKFLVLFFILLTLIIFVANFEPSFADDNSTSKSKTMGKPELREQSGMHGQEMMMGKHHMSYMGMCAPGFAPLDGQCVLDDRCGPGAYAGRICMMDGVMKQYLRPLQQKYAGISVDDIICVEGKQLLFKSSNATPICVNLHSVEKLIQRGGWQSDKPAIACTLDWNPVCGMDGMTYGNMCNLKSQHMAMKHQGECNVEKNNKENETMSQSYSEMIDGVQVVTIKAEEFKFIPSEIHIKPGMTKFVLINNGVGEHEFVVYEASKQDILEKAELAEDEKTIEENILFEIEEVHAGETGESEVMDLNEGSYVIGCLLPGHFDAGMKGTLEIN
ncbi:MAG: plastocyanin/azurin family copper-binding protein [Nitrosopumilaceae archaeon]|jgi:uncharacterized cupredoxin-like copper-binding protein